MSKDIENIDKQGNRHGLQIECWTNGNIWLIENLYHGLWDGYDATFNRDKSIRYKTYWNMNKWLYDENHWFNNQIEIKI